MNELSHGQKIKMPASFVRSVSFQKIKEGSLSARGHSNDYSNKNQSNKIIEKDNKQSNGISKKNPCEFYQKILAKKLENTIQKNNKNNQQKNAHKAEHKTEHHEYIEELRKQLQQKQMKECTFKPKTNNYPGIHRRSLNQFLNHQMAYEKHKEDKVKQMRDMIQAKIQKQNTFRPNMIVKKNNQYSKNDSQCGILHHTQNPVHDRLYEDFKKRSSKQNTLITESIDKTRGGTNSKRKKIATISSQKNQISSVNSSAVPVKLQSAVNPQPIHNQQNITSDFDKKNFTIFSSHNSKTILKSQSGLQSNASKQIISDRIQKTQQTESRGTSRNNSRGRSNNSSSQKGLKVTKYMNVKEVCERKLGRSNNQKHNQQVQSNNQAEQKRNRKNKQIFINKILREISYIIDDTNLISASNDITNLRYLQLCLILQKMNFIQESDNMESRKYVSEIWQMLQGDIYETVPLVNLIKIILCLLGCHEKGIIDYCLKSFMASLPNSENSMRILVISDKDSKKIKSNFEQLSLNRLKKGQYISAHRPTEHNQQYTFKPFVSKNSKQMAEKYRQKIIQQSQELINNKLIQYPVNEDGVVDHVDLLMLDEKRKELKKKIKRQQYQKQQRRMQDQIMLAGGNSDNYKLKTFQNVSNLYGNGSKNQQAYCRTDDLYEMGKWTLRQKKKIQIQQKLPKECTFQPNFNRSKQNSAVSKNIKSHEHNSSDYKADISDLSSRNQVQQIRDFDKSIFRMYEARKMREQEAQKNILRCYKNMNQMDASPMVYLNVNMQGYEQIKVPVFDTDSMKTVTHKVRVLMGIAQQDEEKLQQILKLQIVPALSQLGLSNDFYQ